MNGINLGSVNVSKCHQRKIRERRAELEAGENLFGAYWEDITCSKETALIKDVSRNTAKRIILEYEWLGTLPANYNLYVGLYFDNVLAGVSCFTNVKFGGKYTVFNYPAYCLGRGACVHWAPNWAGSHLVNGACKHLFSKGNPIIVVAYSDWSAGEIGTIYQACNWYYLGHNKTTEWLGPDGKRYDINTPAVRAVPGFARKNNPELVATPEMIDIEKNKMIEQGYRLVEGPVRGRYAMAYGRKCKDKRDMIKTLSQNCKPYPKRNNDNVD